MIVMIYYMNTSLANGIMVVKVQDYENALVDWNTEGELYATHYKIDIEHW